MRSGTTNDEQQKCALFINPFQYLLKSVYDISAYVCLSGCSISLQIKGAYCDALAFGTDGYDISI